MLPKRNDLNHCGSLLLVRRYDSVALAALKSSPIYAFRRKPGLRNLTEFEDGAVGNVPGILNPAGDCSRGLGPERLEANNR